LSVPFPASAFSFHPAYTPLFLILAQNGNERRKQQKQDVKLTNVRDHITPLGFKNDGYDYSQHLKEMGGGRFIGRDGSAHDTPYGRAVELPADALPSEGELDRRLEAVTLSHEVHVPSLPSTPVVVLTHLWSPPPPCHADATR